MDTATDPKKCPNTLPVRGNVTREQETVKGLKEEARALRVMRGAHGVNARELAWPSFWISALQPSAGHVFLRSRNFFWSNHHSFTEVASLPDSALEALSSIVSLLCTACSVRTKLSISGVDGETAWLAAEPSS